MKMSDDTRIMWNCEHKNIVRAIGGVCPYCHEKEIKKARAEGHDEGVREERERMLREHVLDFSTQCRCMVLSKIGELTALGDTNRPSKCEEHGNYFNCAVILEKLKSGERGSEVGVRLSAGATKNPKPASSKRLKKEVNEDE